MKPVRQVQRPACGISDASKYAKVGRPCGWGCGRGGFSLWPTGIVVIGHRLFVTLQGQALEQGLGEVERLRGWDGDGTHAERLEGGYEFVERGERVPEVLLYDPRSPAKRSLMLANRCLRVRGTHDFETRQRFLGVSRSSCRRSAV